MSHPHRNEPIGIKSPDDYGWGVFHRRHPAMLAELVDTFPYPNSVRAALDDLLEETTTGTVQPLPAVGPHAAQWEHEVKPAIGRRWSEVNFFWAESVFYRKLLLALEYFSIDSPWWGIDPFGPKKNRELEIDRLRDRWNNLAALNGLGRDERRQAVLRGSLWGNLADLAVSIDDPGVGDASTRRRLLADDGDALWGYLDAAAPGTVIIVADNAGSEIIADLVLVDQLLREETAARVEIHVKNHPYFVSDATGGDLVSALRALADAPHDSVRAIAERLREWIASGRLVIDTHWFYTAPRTFTHVPTDLWERFRRASLVVLKGDLNYRRLMEDRHHDYDQDFGEAVATFPTAVVALRVMKSDLAVGIDPVTVRELSAANPDWRTDAGCAVLQMADGAGGGDRDDARLKS
ncbi:damage-control phosphatase ARMT1 family protein [Haloglycomyces albus]|uniref:damage-control phosphatase ARMT1 family protein n=1 Tax=Haloglycomyces albus TaxID=526067 RepID=UPI00046CFCBD|nr:damage-control phosphatase ARMT1 family protein [Haloglycomyces albus]